MAGLTTLPEVEGTVRVGVVSDTHLGSRNAALDALHTVYDEFLALGITTVLHAGDVVAGLGIYRQQVTDDLDDWCTTYSGQVEYAERSYPTRPGITTLMIAGNHDLDGEFRRRASNPVAALARRRRDIQYIGDEHARLALPGGRHALVAHGTGPSGYAHSYRAQRFIEALPERRRPNLLILGHYHRAGVIRHQGVTCVMAGCLQIQTPFLRAQGIDVDVGGWVLTVRGGSISTEWLAAPKEMGGS